MPDICHHGYLNKFCFGDSMLCIPHMNCLSNCIQHAADTGAMLVVRLGDAQDGDIATTRVLLPDVKKYMPENRFSDSKLQCYAVMLKCQLLQQQS